MNSIQTRPILQHIPFHFPFNNEYLLRAPKLNVGDWHGDCVDRRYRACGEFPRPACRQQLVTGSEKKKKKKISSIIILVHG